MGAMQFKLVQRLDLAEPAARDALVASSRGVMVGREPIHANRNTRRKSVKSIQLILATAVAIGAAIGAARADGETIAVFTKNQTNPFFQNVRVGAASAAKQMGASVIQYVPTKPDSIPEQMS